MKKVLLIIFLLFGISQSLKAQEDPLEKLSIWLIERKHSDILFIDPYYDFPMPQEKLLKTIAVEKSWWAQTKPFMVEKGIDSARHYGGNCFKMTFYTQRDTLHLFSDKSQYPYRMTGEIYNLDSAEIAEIRLRMENYQPVEKIQEEKPEEPHPINPEGDNKGWIGFHWSFPYINNLQMSPLGEPAKNGTGFIGISYGVDYFHSARQYVNFTYSGVMDYGTPVIFVPYGDEHEVLSSTYLSLSNNHRLDNFSLGYGLVFARNSWELVNLFWEDKIQQNIEAGRQPEEKYYYSLGLMFSTYFHTSGASCFGLLYKPTFLRLNSEQKFTYAHSISIDFAFKIPIYRSGKSVKVQ
ncbi:MAG: hypothetical protein V4642_06930 [Bacteroidota bacterium]